VKFNGPKVKLSRRLSIPLTPKAARVMERRQDKPGMHAGRPQRMSDYALQLLEKQRLRFQYNVSEKQMRGCFAKASRMKGRTGENMVCLLERRLDAFVLRSGFAPSIFAARQVVGHGHIEVNGRRSRSSSLTLRPGDKVSIREGSRTKQIFDMDWAAYEPPSYIERGELEATLTRTPARDEVPITCDEQVVVEFYSR